MNEKIAPPGPRDFERYRLLLQKQEEVGGFCLPLSEISALWNLKKTGTWHVARKLLAAGLLKYRNGKYLAVRFSRDACSSSMVVGGPSSSYLTE